jgi:hypothetical protein
MTVWIGDVRYEAEELMAMLKADVSLLTTAIERLQVAREMKLGAIRLAWLMTEQRTSC